MSSARLAAASLVLFLAPLGCSSNDEPSGQRGGATPGGSPVAPRPSRPTAEPTTERAVPLRPAGLRVTTAVRAVQRLAGQIGPRHATSPAFRRAAGWVSEELTTPGYEVRQQRVDVPAGVSWGVPVGAGVSHNVVATPRDVDPRRPHLLVGAHLDTVPQAPGAEDNASGVGVLLAVAEALEERAPRLPVVLVAFGAEEPRGPTDADHHYGSRAYVEALEPAERRAVRGMLSLDRVGVGSVVPVSAAGPAGARQRETVLAAARRAGVPTDAQVNRSSDHWSFVRAGMPGIRLGSTPYAGYHSSADVPSVVSRAQLGRTGRLVLAWLR